MNQSKLEMMSKIQAQYAIIRPEHETPQEMTKRLNEIASRVATGLLTVDEGVTLFIEPVREKNYRHDLHWGIA